MSKLMKGGITNEVPTTWIKRDVTASVLAQCKSVWGNPTDEQLVRTEVEPSAFHCSESFRQVYWQAEMWSKFPFALQGVDRREVALQSFLQAEQQCADTNRRLVDLFARSDVPENIRNVLLRAKRRLNRLFEGFTLDEVVRHARWGSGASTGLPATISTPQNKWVFASHCTPRCLPYVDAWIGYSGWLPSVDPALIIGNSVDFVPKNAKTERSIALEPDWNMFFQLGVGGVIRSRLQRWGVLLPIAQDVNKALARKGSQDGFLATIDLKGASDTIALALVEALLPPNVYQTIIDLRSSHGTLDKGQTWFAYEKVSSMGNGFTFELETALFWAITSEAAGHAMVYGDDIVVPSSTVGWVETVLAYCGFTVNTKKTHYGSSKFRESCGGHYFAGVDVTPPYIRERLVGVTRVAFINRLRELCRDQVMPHLLPAAAAAARGIPRLFFGPPGVDGCVHSEWDEARPRWNRNLQSWSGFRIMVKWQQGRCFDLGALRQSLRRGPSELSYQRQPGRPVTVVKKWSSDEWRKPAAGAS